MSLTRTGVMEFVFPTDFREARKFGRKAYWIRALYGDKTAAGSSDIAIPTITGIFLNTTWARQCETITGEIAGSSDGTSGQTFSLKKIPVISGSEDIWIDEFKTISAEERTQIKKEEVYQVREVLDSEGNLTGFWVRWEPIESILNASADDRSYEIDNVSGELTFGNGIYGKIPPTGADNITADYRSGGGKHGNLPAYEVKELKTSLPFLDKAFNPLAAGAGTDTETIEQLMVRGPYLVKHRNRAVTVEDFEKLAFRCSPGIARVKCLANMNERREPQNGSVTVIVIPQTEEEKPMLSLLLQQKVEQCLQAHAAFTLVEPGHLKVIGPIYVEVSLEAAVAATSVHVVPLVENDCISRLKEFLNPLTGGYEQEGWEFGKIPCFSDFYALLEKIDGVDHVETFSVKLRLEEDPPIEVELSPDNPELGADFRMPVYSLVCSGKHKVEVSWQ
jgi:predicted phage baseplate assembly protein